MLVTPWWMSNYIIKRGGSSVYKIRIANTLADINMLQRQYPSDFIVLPAGTEWYDIHNKPSYKINYSNLSAKSIYSFPFKALSIIKNTPCKYIYVEWLNSLIEFQDNTAIFHNCTVVNE